LTLASEFERVISDIYYSLGGTINLIDAHEWFSVVPSTTIKKFFNIPFIFSIESLEDHRSNYARSPLNIAIKKIERLGIEESCMIIVKSDWMKAEVKKIHDVSDEKIVLISPSSPTWIKDIKEIYQSAIGK